ncbi:MAG: Uma2 family endonuclease [Thermomicrobiales bacterium]|nr:Uma2 family endonuclease [Thermomicrobiales bacterium]
MTATALMTAEELYALPEDERGELVRGEMRLVAPVNIDHVIVVGRLIGRLEPFCRAHDLGIIGPEGGFKLARDPDVVLAPDVAYIRADRVPPRGQRTGFQEIVPDLAVEVASPGDSASEMTERVRIYLEAGVRLVWVIDPVSETATVYAADRSARLLLPGDVLEGGDVLPDFALPLDDLFA